MIAQNNSRLDIKSFSKNGLFLRIYRKQTYRWDILWHLIRMGRFNDKTVFVAPGCLLKKSGFVKRLPMSINLFWYHAYTNLTLLNPLLCSLNFPNYWCYIFRTFFIRTNLAAPFSDKTLQRDNFFGQSFKKFAKDRTESSKIDLVTEKHIHRKNVEPKT